MNKKPFRLMGKKLGMMEIFDEDGHVIPCTVIEVEPNVVVQVKTEDVDGYTAVQMGWDEIRVKKEKTLQKRVSNPLRGHFSKANVAPRRHLMECLVDDPESYEVGQAFDVTFFKDAAYIDTTALSKGKGFQGVMKRHGFRGLKASHGTGPVHRSGGSTGNRSTPGRCFPGRKMPGRMGGKRVTTQNLRVMEIDEKRNLLIVRGAVPGPCGGRVIVSPAIKKVA